VLILAFIFLTPKSWFISHPPVQTVFVLASDVVDKREDSPEVAMRAKQQLNRTNGQVVKVKSRYDGSGKIIAYEVDIR
jgi:hypothetical protein